MEARLAPAEGIGPKVTRAVGALVKHYVEITSPQPKPGDRFDAGAPFQGPAALWALGVSLEGKLSFPAAYSIAQSALNAGKPLSSALLSGHSSSAAHVFDLGPSSVGPGTSTSDLHRVISQLPPNVQDMVQGFVPFLEHPAFAKDAVSLLREVANDGPRIEQNPELVLRRILTGFMPAEDAEGILSAAINKAARVDAPPNERLTALKAFFLDSNGSPNAALREDFSLPQGVIAGLLHREKDGAYSHLESLMDGMKADSPVAVGQAKDQFTAWLKEEHRKDPSLGISVWGVDQKDFDRLNRQKDLELTLLADGGTEAGAAYLKELITPLQLQAIVENSPVLKRHNIPVAAVLPYIMGVADQHCRTNTDQKIDTELFQAFIEELPGTMTIRSQIKGLMAEFSPTQDGPRFFAIEALSYMTWKAGIQSIYPENVLEAKRAAVECGVDLSALTDLLKFFSEKGLIAPSRLPALLELVSPNPTDP